MHNSAVDGISGEQQVMDFFAIVLKDEALLERLMAAMDARDNAVVISMANQHDYSFDRESWHRGLKKLFNLIAPVVQ